MTFSKTELEKKIEPAKSLLDQYIQLLLKWQKSINLIAPSTIQNIWERHILDSALLYFLLDSNVHTLMDVGSGAGLPGMIIAILNHTFNGPLNDILLVESDLKKSLFLEECQRSLNVPVRVVRERVENLRENPDIITARAFAPLKDLLELVQNNVSRETILLLPKGKNVEAEIKNNIYPCEIQRINNTVNTEGYILKIKGVTYA